MNAALYLLPVAAYLYGSVPVGFLMARHIKGVDIRTVGSGNIGATNAARVLGFRYFPLVFALDFTKGLLPALVATLLLTEGAAQSYSPHPLAAAAAAGGVLGHVFPVYLGFKGGKAVAAGAGAFLVLAPWSLAAAALTWAVVFAAARYVSLASVCAAVALAASAWFLTPDATTTGVFGAGVATVGAVAVIALHRANIKRLLSGKERKIGRPKKPPSDAAT